MLRVCFTRDRDICTAVAVKQPPGPSELCFLQSRSVSIRNFKQGIFRHIKLIFVTKIGWCAVVLCALRLFHRAQHPTRGRPHAKRSPYHWGTAYPNTCLSLGYNKKADFFLKSKNKSLSSGQIRPTILFASLHISWVLITTLLIILSQHYFPKTIRTIRPGSGTTLHHCLPLKSKQNFLKTRVKYGYFTIHF